MAKPISPRWLNAAAASLSSRIIRAGIPLGSWPASIGVCGASPCPPTHCAAVGQGNPQAVADRLNSTALKCLGYRTPHKVVGEQIALLKPG